MRKRFCLMLIVFLIISNKLTSQNNQEYSRNSISVLFIKHSGENLSIFDYINDVQVPDKYDYNFFGNNAVNVDFPMISTNMLKYNSLYERLQQLIDLKSNDQYTISQIRNIRNEIQTLKALLAVEESERNSEIINSISRNKIPNNVLGSVLMDNKLGYMTTDVIAQRGMYNATDAQYLTAMNSERKLAMIKDEGQALLKNTYLFVFDITNYYSKEDEKDSRLKTIYVTGNAYLMKLKVDQLMADGQWDDLIFLEPNKQKLEKFNNFNFPYQIMSNVPFMVSTANYKVDAGGTGVNLLTNLISSVTKNNNNSTKEISYQFKSDAQIQQELLEKTITEADNKFTRIHEQFKVRSGIYAVNPLSVKIGTKENLKKDHLFKVSETRISKKGDTTERKIGWVRAKKVVNNRVNSSGKTEPSLFYKVASKKIARGMRVSHVPEKGFIIGVGYNYNLENTSDAANGDILKSTGLLDGPVINVDYITHLTPGLRVGMELGGMQKISTQDVVYETGGESTGLTFTGNNMFAGLTIQKIFQANRIEFTPLIGGYYSTITYDKYSDNSGTEYLIKENSSLVGLKSSQYGITGGLKLGLNLGRNFQLNIGYKYAYKLKDSFNNDNEKGVDITDDYGATLKFIYAQPGTVSFGLRLFGF